jgi:hypothetical protein
MNELERMSSSRRDDARCESADRQGRRRYAAEGGFDYVTEATLVVDREKLKSASCECYATTTALLKNVTRTNPLVRPRPVDPELSRS